MEAVTPQKAMENATGLRSRSGRSDPMRRVFLNLGVAAKPPLPNSKNKKERGKPKKI